MLTEWWQVALGHLDFCSASMLFLFESIKPWACHRQKSWLAKRRFYGAIETSAMTPLLCRPWTKCPSILKFEETRRSVAKVFDPIMVGLWGKPSTMWWFKRPSSSIPNWLVSWVPSSFSTIRDKTSIPRQHCAIVEGGYTWCQTTKWWRATHDNWLSCAWRYKYKVSCAKLQWKPSKLRSFVSIFAWVTSPVALVVLLHAANLQPQP